ncbi:hypothetical protein QQX98_000698 [Neonectria punicea]|uniref:Glycoside hydrolase family 127 protein n=1 Tax=Neonectria punicea TaxID=979145 RepID=A0ABR1HS94_9HYPO
MSAIFARPSDLESTSCMAILDTLSNTLNRLWNDMVDKKMYVTGGIGAIKQWEVFGVEYFLPQSTDEGGCYAETCASISVMMLAERLLHLDLQGRYGDIMELCLYNNVMTAMSLDGKEFTYVNQLAGSNTDKSVRHSWFWCACCPPNLARLYSSLGGYLWDYGSHDQQAFINVHLYTTAKLAFEVNGESIALEQKSEWLWEGDVAFEVSAPDSLETTIRLRLPAWTQYEFELTPPPHPGCIQLCDGYLSLTHPYVAAHPSFALRVKNFGPQHIAMHPHTNQNTSTLARGPIIYYAEDIEQPLGDGSFQGCHH